MIRASIDLGTNTCLLIVAEVDAKLRRVGRVLHDESRIVRLGEGVDRARRLKPEAMERTLSALKDYAKRLESLGGDPSQAVCVATSSSRDSANGAEFYERVTRETGFRFRVISGADEARLTFIGGLLPGMDPARSAVIDIGGGSTEVIDSSGGMSLDVGSVRFTERYLKSDPVKDSEFWECRDQIDQALRTLTPDRPGLELVAVAGTATTLAQLQLKLPHFDASAIDGCELTRGDLHRMVEELKWRSVAERRAMVGMEPERADVMLAGALILWRAHEVLGFGSCRVSTRGLRYGALLEDV